MTAQSPVALNSLAKLLTTILHEHVEPEMVATVEVTAWPLGVIKAITHSDDTYAFDVSQSEVRKIVCLSIKNQCIEQIEPIERAQGLPFKMVKKGDFLFRIQNKGYSCCVFYGYGEGRYNCPFDSVKVMYCGQFPDTCLGEIIMREEKTKGKGPNAIKPARKSEWFDER